jgi:hypothetical protein
LLRSLRIWKAKAKLRLVSQEIVKERLQALRKQQSEAAFSLQEKLHGVTNNDGPTTVAYDAALDPQPLLKLRAEDKSLVQNNEDKFLSDLVGVYNSSPVDSSNPNRPTNARRSKNLAMFLHKTKPWMVRRRATSPSIMEPQL